jgi:selenium metabolism protein YedF
MEFVDDTCNLIDVRGTYFPSLAENIKSRLAEPGLPFVVTIVDNIEDRDRVVSVARELNLNYKVYSEETNFYVRIDKEEIPSLPKDLATDFSQVLLITSNTLGQGEGVLGSLLMELFLSELPRSGVLPQSVIFVNSGVFLVCEGSVALRDLMELEKRNVRIFACNNSLEFYGLKEKQCVGSAIKAFTMANYLVSAIKVVTLG